MKITADTIIHTKVEVARVYFRIHFIKKKREAGSADRGPTLAGGITGSIAGDTEELGPMVPGKIQAATKKKSDVEVEGEERWRGVEV